MRIILTGIILLLGSTLYSLPPGGTVKGRVTDMITGDPIPGVYVIYGKNLGTTTDQEGSYNIQGVSGRITVTFQFVGYEPFTAEIQVTDGETAELSVQLRMKVREIDQIVVSASKNEQRIAELTVSMDVINSSFLTDNHITDAQEVITKTPGIEILDGQASIRGGSGFSYGAGSRVMALIDGLPVVSADAGNIKWQFLPLENLAQIEIIKGASSVLYGSSALNGVINFRTADATNIPSTQFFAEAGIYGRPGNKNWIWWDTPRLNSSVSFSHLEKRDKTDIGIGVNLLADEGYRRLNGEKLGRISLKMKHFNKNADGLSYGLNINAGVTEKRDFVLWENAETGALKQQESATIELRGSSLSADPYITYRKSERTKHDLRMRFLSTMNRFPESEKTNSDSYSLMAEYQLLQKLTGLVDLTAGLSGNYSYVNSNMYNDHTGLNLAAYSQIEIRPVNRLKAVAGVRLERYSLDGKDVETVPVFRTGINWQAGEYTFLRASFGQGYRYPSIAEKFASTTLGSVNIFPNPEVLSESGWSAEVGIKQGLQLGRFTGQGDLSLFLSQNTNLIEYYLSIYEGKTGFKATNIEQSRIYGGEMEMIINGNFGRVNTTISGGYTYIYPAEINKITNRNTGDYLKYRRKHSGKLTINTTWKKLVGEMSLFARSKILRIDDFFLQEVGELILPGFPGYWVGHNTGYFMADAVAGYKITDRLTISFAAKNFTNTEYMGRPADIQPQRNFSLRISGKFHADVNR